MRRPTSEPAAPSVGRRVCCAPCLGGERQGTGLELARRALVEFLGVRLVEARVDTRRPSSPSRAPRRPIRRGVAYVSHIWKSPAQNSPAQGVLDDVLGQGFQDVQAEERPQRRRSQLRHGASEAGRGSPESGKRPSSFKQPSSRDDRTYRNPFGARLAPNFCQAPLPLPFGYRRRRCALRLAGPRRCGQARRRRPETIAPR